MIELTLFEAIVWGSVLSSLVTLVVVPLAIRYLTPNKEK